VKMKENCAIIEMSKNPPLQKTKGDTLFPAPVPAGPRCGNPGGIRCSILFYMNAALED